jgi:phage nucleotide-binding protein
MSPEKTTVRGAIAPKIGKMQPTSTLRMMVYGRGGVGKTMLLASAVNCPEMQPVLFVGCDGGEMSVATLYPEVDATMISSWPEALGVLELLINNRSKYKTVIVDGALSLYRRIMNDYLRSTASSASEQYTPEQTDWNQVHTKFLGFVDELKGLPANILMCTGDDTRPINGRSGPTMTTTDLPGKVRDTLPGMFDVVAHMRLEYVGGSAKRRIQVKPTSSVYAKNRSPYENMCPPVIELDDLPDTITPATKDMNMSNLFAAFVRGDVKRVRGVSMPTFVKQVQNKEVSEAKEALEANSPDQVDQA